VPKVARLEVPLASQLEVAIGNGTPELFAAEQLDEVVRNLAMEPVSLVKMGQILLGKHDDGSACAWIGVAPGTRQVALLALHHGVYWVVHGVASKVLRSEEKLEATPVLLSEVDASSSATATTEVKLSRAAEQFQIESSSEWTMLREKNPLDSLKRLILSSVAAFGAADRMCFVVSLVVDEAPRSSAALQRLAGESTS